MVIMNLLTNPILSLQPGILGILRGGMVSGCVREVILKYVNVAPLTLVGAWCMALGLWRRIYYTHTSFRLIYAMAYLHRYFECMCMYTHYMCE